MPRLTTDEALEICKLRGVVGATFQVVASKGTNPVRRAQAGCLGAITPEASELDIAHARTGSSGGSER
jgi:hypothetical protein